MTSRGQGDESCVILLRKKMVRVNSGKKFFFLKLTWLRHIQFIIAGISHFTNRFYMHIGLSKFLLEKITRQENPRYCLLFLLLYQNKTNSPYGVPLALFTNKQYLKILQVNHRPRSVDGSSGNWPAPLQPNALTDPGNFSSQCSPALGNFSH